MGRCRVMPRGPDPNTRYFFLVTLRQRTYTLTV